MDVSLSDLIETGKHFESSGESLAQLAVARNDVTVWLARLDLDDAAIARCASFLSPDESRRAERFHHANDKRRFVIARGTLRMLLARQLDTSPMNITFGYSTNCKPYLSRPGDTLLFNLSHSADLALFAFSAKFEVGVDIECLDREVDCQPLALRFFSAAEAAALQKIEASRCKHAFLTCWTRKEAVIKATGVGLTQPLNQFQVTIEPDAAPRIVSTQVAGLADCALYALDVGKGFVATLAVYAAQHHNEVGKNNQTITG